MPDIQMTIFRENDIRGRVPQELDENAVFLIGRAFGSFLQEAGLASVALGRDNRLAIDADAPDSAELAAAMLKGMLQSGCQAFDLGAVPTPVTYFTVLKRGLDAGVSLTGSHNPRQYNGVKMFLNDRQGNRIRPLEPEQMQGLAARILQDRFVTASGQLKRVGEAFHEEVLEDYRLKILSRLGPAPRPVQVVVDPGNAVAAEVAPQLLSDLGHAVDCLNCRLDGAFPDHTPNPEQRKNLASLSRRVLETRAQIGVAYDGDADRLGVVDERGEKVRADLLLLLLALDLLNRQPGAKIVFDGLCTEALAEQIRLHGGVPIRSKTGYNPISRRLHAEGAALAGEISGHIFFRDRGFWGYDDGILASCRILGLLADQGLPISQLLKGLPLWSVMEQVRPSCPAEHKQRVLENIRRKLAEAGAQIETVDGIWASFYQDHAVVARAVVRAASTEESLSLMCEGRTPSDREQIQTLLFAILDDELSPGWNQ